MNHAMGQYVVIHYQCRSHYLLNKYFHTLLRKHGNNHLLALATTLAASI
jgi:hypothetical protein